MILLIDNYDSFTFNLYQYLGELGQEIKVVRNDQITVEEIEKLDPDAIVLSPGPGRPEQAGVIVEVIQQFYRKLPILGICLGHQAIGYAFGAKIEKAKKIMHGKVSNLKHNGSQLFQYMPQPISIMRYHSLIIQSGTLPGSFKVLARSMDDNEIMAIKHEDYSLYGLQFHPESVGTDLGKRILENFLQTIRREEESENNTAEVI
ncbi:aminodeoxychorismate/anthranilate synthase component II [Cytobacillus firmus]|jgi:anthranilate synthase component II|uniref:anthranilate synthase component II n=1 Tax=Cytobacillus firmus TaxID=1399 RepID=UPI00064F809E|nr:aminodeoxychorismate/anthranilate synthase component II [Cytobacillus firmus]KML37227.1 anthranilate synthase subunit II [Cytobacillus firmus]MBG9446984.1 anthranilate synthase subunit II [Cytobacillus firmus]MBG9451644.1 anthranilate synthase subunit II [Cytobacillus firmus]MCS0653778.1 aminodeoxychorismate/anthranilate synthase component II [Cytobacillus firmus]USK37498.1 aminodeoxychorismate/anthranilate synthase component II [Cytobacillus firmus]